LEGLQIIHLSSLELLDHTRQTTDQLKGFLSVNHADIRKTILRLDEFLNELIDLIKRIDDPQKESLKGHEDLMNPTTIKEILINQIVGQITTEEPSKGRDNLIHGLIKRNYQVSVRSQTITKLLEHQVILTEDPQMTITGMIITLEIQEGEYLLTGNVVVILVDLVTEETTEKVREEALVDLEDLEALEDLVDLVDLVDPADLEDLEDLEILDTLEISIQKITTLDMEVPPAPLDHLAPPAHLVIKKMKNQITDGHQYLPMLLITMECLGIIEKLDGLH
jgi:hypothetical protein